MSTGAIVPTAVAGTTSSTSSNSTTPQGLDTMFLQLLVAQLQNQSPLNPLDPSQFVGQLAQFSELSTVTSIYQLLQQVVSAGSGSGSGGSASGATAGSSTPSSATNGAATNPTYAPAGAPAAIPDALNPASSLIHKIQGGF
jgi:flagellar basal-body rod modification protein FlgD